MSRERKRVFIVLRRVTQPKKNRSFLRNLIESNKSDVGSALLLSNRFAGIWDEREKLGGRTAPLSLVG